MKFIAFVLFSLTLTASSWGTTKKSLYERLGGQKGVAELSEAYIAQISKDDRIDQNPDIKSVKEKIPPIEAANRLTKALCKASGGPCKTTKEDLLKGIPANIHLGPKDWFYLAQDANRVMDAKKIGATERKDLLALLLGAKGK